MSDVKRRCFGSFLLPSANICLECEFWKECQKRSGKA